MPPPSEGVRTDFVKYRNKRTNCSPSTNQFLALTQSSYGHAVKMRSRSQQEARKSLGRKGLRPPSARQCVANSAAFGILTDGQRLRHAVSVGTAGRRSRGCETTSVPGKSGYRMSDTEAGVPIATGGSRLKQRRAVVFRLLEAG